MKRKFMHNYYLPKYFCVQDFKLQSQNLNKTRIVHILQMTLQGAIILTIIKILKIPVL